jgi:diacylglycerol kinase (ATP)
MQWEYSSQLVLLALWYQFVWQYSEMAIPYPMICMKYLFMPPAQLSGGNGSQKKLLNTMEQKIFSARSRLSSFEFAFKGIFKFFQQEPNAWIHLVASIIVFIAAGFFEVSNNELISLVVVTGFVWVAEIFNTVVERIMDFISIKKNPGIEFIKDLAAGGVLVSAITAIVTGVIVFVPKLF